MKTTELPNIFRMAKKVQKLSTYPKARIGASIILGNKIISVGYNQGEKAHPLVRKFNKFQGLHAEIHAVLGCKKRYSDELLKGAKIVVYRENKDGELAMCRPCSVCQKILSTYGVKKMIYTTNGGWNSEDITEGQK